eukprot:gene3972-biopygen21690
MGKSKMVAFITSRSLETSVIHLANAAAVDAEGAYISQIIEYSSGVIPPTARFWNDDISDADLTEDEMPGHHDDDDDFDDDDLKSATSADNGGGTPSTSTRVFDTSPISPVFEPAPPSVPVQTVGPEVAFSRPSKLPGSASFVTAPNPLERAVAGYNLRSSSAAGTSQEPPPPPPVEMPPPAPPPPMGLPLSCQSWEHLLTGGPAPYLTLRNYRLVRRAQVDADSVDRTLFGRLSVPLSQANKDSKGRVMVLSELGQQCRLFLGPVIVGIRYPSETGVSFGGGWRAAAKKVEYQFLKRPFPRCPVEPDFEQLVSFARSLPVIRNIDDQRAYDAGLAAEYFLRIRKSYAPLTPAASSASHDIRWRHSDTLAAGVPLLVNELHGAVMRPDERVDDFFRRVRGYCSDLRSAGSPVTLHYAMGVIIGGIRLARFDSLRIKYGMMRHLQVGL